MAEALQPKDGAVETAERFVTKVLHGYGVGSLLGFPPRHAITTVVGLQNQGGDVFLKEMAQICQMATGDAAGQVGGLCSWSLARACGEPSGIRRCSMVSAEIYIECTGVPRDV